MNRVYVWRQIGKRRRFWRFQEGWAPLYRATLFPMPCKDDEEFLGLGGEWVELAVGDVVPGRPLFADPR